MPGQTYTIARFDQIELAREGLGIVGSVGHEHVMPYGQIVGWRPFERVLGGGTGLGHVVDYPDTTDDIVEVEYVVARLGAADHGNLHVVGIG